MKILLVDDDEALNTIFITAFKKSGFEGISAKDGTSGLDLVVVKPNGIYQFGDDIRNSLEEAKRNTVESIKKKLQLNK